MNAWPIENVLGVRAWFISSYLDFSRSLPRPLIRTHKQVLGPQTRCWTGP